MKSIFAVTAALSCLVFVGCQPKEAVGPVDFAHQQSDLPVDEAVQYGKLPNGVRYAVLKNDTPTKTAALRMRFNTGSLNERDEQRGLAHYLEHMAFNGSKNIPEGEMVKRLERFGLAFGADTNAYTSFDETVYTLDLPEVSEEIINETLMIMRETAENLLLDQDAIERERGVVQAEKRRSDSPGTRAQLASLEFLTRGSRISDRLPIGTDETLKSMGSDLFRDYYQSYYRPENTFIVLVGDIETDYTATKISEYFADWQAVGEPGAKQDAGITEARGANIGFFTDPEIQTSVTLATIKPFTDEEDTVANRKKSFIEGLGNRILNRRLASLAREADAEFISGGAGYSYSLETAEIMSLSMSSRPENWERALAVGEQELRKALEFGFTQAELDEQIANSRKSLQVRVQTADTRRTGSLASGILSAFSGESVFTHPTTGLDRFEAYAGEITLDEVWAAFKEQWSGLDKPLLYLQTSELLEQPEEQIRGAYEVSKLTPVEANIANEDSAFAYTEFGTPGKIVSERHIEDVDAHLIKFENNVLLNFKKTDFAKDQVNISISVGDGAFSMPKKSAALQFLTSNVMAAGGLEAHSADDIQRLMAGKAVGVSFGIGATGFALNGSTVPSDLPDQFNLMAAQLIAPGYRAEAKSRYDKYIESWYPTLDSTPGGVASRDIDRILHSNDRRYGIPAQTDLLAVEIDEVSAWLNPQLADGQIEIGVVGDIDKDLVIEQVARTFGALPTRKLGREEYPDMMRVSFPKAPKKPITLSHSGDANRALLRVYWPAPDGTDIMRSRRLSILRTVFGNRLTDVIREEEGAAYSPSAGRNGSRFYKGYGYMSASLSLTPEKVPEMIKKLDEVAADFQAGNISDDEFNRAIKPVLENLDSSLENNGYWMRVIANAQTDDWDVDNFRTREDAFTSMTLDDIKPLAADIFNADKAVRIQVLPEG